MAIVPPAARTVTGRTVGTVTVRVVLPLSGPSFHGRTHRERRWSDMRAADTQRTPHVHRIFIGSKKVRVDLLDSLLREASWISAAEIC